MHAIETIIGPIARPKHVYIVPDMPKTRSGKIMRRVLAAISNTMDIGDVTTLANPEVVEEIRKMVQGEGVVVDQRGPGGLEKLSARSGRPGRTAVALDGQQKRQFQQRLSQWYRRYGRDLPWRRTTDPYAILVSEVMLQQTQVERVMEYYRRFLARFPTVAALAAASSTTCSSLAGAGLLPPGAQPASGGPAGHGTPPGGVS